VHVHEHEPAMSRVVSGVLLFPLRAAHGVIANSGATRQWLADSTSPATAARTRVVHNGVPEQRSAEVRPAAGLRASLVVVGRLSERKGQDLAIQATAVLRDRGHDVTLTVVGDCFPGYEDVAVGLERLVDELGISDRVSFVGFQDPSPYLAGADIVVVPSRVESFGLVAAEALMLGRPTVATRVGGLPEVITDGATGRLVEPGRADALADAIGDLLDHPEVAAKMGRNGQVDARRRFSAESFATRFRNAMAGREVVP
jgi:glycosyltransferase involved in cell wall biosynthesis